MHKGMVILLAIPFMILEYTVLVIRNSNNFHVSVTSRISTSSRAAPLQEFSFIPI